MICCCYHCRLFDDISSIDKVNGSSRRIENRKKSADSEADDEPSRYYASLRDDTNSTGRHNNIHERVVSGNHTLSGLSRIPEYAEDIYPYATYHLTDQDNGSPGPSNSTVPPTSYEVQRSLPINAKIGVDGGAGITTTSRIRKKSKHFNTESEEYDSLGSDTDTAADTEALHRNAARNLGPSNNINLIVGVDGHIKLKAISPRFHGNKDKLPIRESHTSKLVLFYFTNIYIFQPKRSMYLLAQPPFPHMLGGGNLEKFKKNPFFLAPFRPRNKLSRYDYRDGSNF